MTRTEAPKGTDLSVHDREHLDAVAARLTAAHAKRSAGNPSRAPA
ncbi:hypothetical protein [Streptomyces sp. NPDC085529]